MERGGIEGSDIDTQGKAKKDKKKRVWDGHSYFFQSKLWNVAKKNNQIIYFLINIVISQAQI